jgi:hypothetical protein
MDNLERLLEAQKNQTPRFNADFKTVVMEKISDLAGNEVKIIQLWQQRFWRVAAACVVALLVSAYALDGSLTFDSLLGFSEHSDLEIGQSYQTYSNWDIDIIE